jgi:hypothetical protein
MLVAPTISTKASTFDPRLNPGWTWAINPSLPIPTWGTGQAPREAKAAFRKAWERFHPSLTPHAIEHWHRHQDAKAKRLS